ncbi:MAG TPA: phytoene synthase [Bacteroidales bacterium]|nr:phytoene synthase [Bacteroidales bacterium]
MIELYNDISFRTSRLVTQLYSTSFSRAVSYLNSDIRDAIYSIYGFVRLADEIVDTFHDFNKQYLLDKFEKDYDDARETGISLNPVLNSFMITVNKYNIDDDLIRAFLKSMKIDLFKSDHNSRKETEEYIYGSAEVVGLMCLKVFVNGKEELYNELQIPAKKLGAAFQKVNFLRDIKNDTEILKRKYFHDLVSNKFDESLKNKLIKEIESDFADSMPGMKKLPRNSRLGVLIAYLYYRKLLKKISRTPAENLLRIRVRVPDLTKMVLLLKAYLVNKLNLL